MFLNQDLYSIVEGLVESLPLSILERERIALSERYRENRNKSTKVDVLSSDHQRLAYLATRFPATYAVVAQVFKELRFWCRGDASLSLLDVGAGPGTALWGALEVFPGIAQATLIERDGGFIALGQKLAKCFENIDIQWVKKDLLSTDAPLHDIVIASYSLGELAEKEREEAVARLWKHTGKFLIIIEPGTPLGFSNILQMREALVRAGAFLLAPCPHAGACPLSKSDWCHFSARVERSSLHRKVKGGALNYEDEKYSYLIFSKEELSRCTDRIVRHPFHGSGFVKFKICSESGIEEETITKKQKEHYSVARKLKWGDRLTRSD